MDPLTAFVIGAIIVAVLFAFVNFRFLLYPILPRLNPMRNAPVVAFSGATLFISDLHLKAGRPFPYSQAIRRFLEQRGVCNLVVVGDLFDSPQDARELMSKDAVMPISEILGFGGLEVMAFAFQGSPPHDPPQGEGGVFAGSALAQLGLCAILGFGSVRVVAYHGHDMSWKGAVGHGWDRFVSGLSLERAWKRFAHVDEGDWVVLGHTHIPGIDLKHRVANCGGWQSKGFLVRPACTGLLLTPETIQFEIVSFRRMR